MKSVKTLTWMRHGLRFATEPCVDTPTASRSHHRRYRGKPVSLQIGHPTESNNEYYEPLVASLKNREISNMNAALNPNS
jgi:hypothetical protein